MYILILLCCRFGDFDSNMREEKGKRRRERREKRKKIIN